MLTQREAWVLGRGQRVDDQASQAKKLLFPAMERNLRAFSTDTWSLGQEHTKKVAMEIVPQN